MSCVKRHGAGTQTECSVWDWEAECAAGRGAIAVGSWRVGCTGWGWRASRLELTVSLSHVSEYTSESLWLVRVRDVRVVSGVSIMVSIFGFSYFDFFK